ncbi:tetratricopeptide repeat protein [Fuscibacter oryzae]|nr:tetratricopeptide repeat protein [Fuscibacter oryzae]
MVLRSVKAALATSALALWVLGHPAWADDGNPGAYLAAQAALAQHDFAGAADWYGQSLLADPTNPLLLEGAALSNLSLGRMDEASRLAAAMTTSDKPGLVSFLTQIDAGARKGDFGAVLATVKSDPGAGTLLVGLVTAWSELGQGRMSEALDAFDTLAKTRQLANFALYHKALALASAGDYQSADNILSGKAAGPISMTRRGVVAHLQILSQMERNADALKLLDQAFGTGPDPLADDLRRRLTAGEPLPFDMARNAKDGLAEAFYTLATALNGQAEDAYTLLYSRIATDLRPDNADAVLMTAGLLEQLGQHDLATEAYAKVPADSPIFHIAEMGRADAAYASGRKDAAVEIMQTLARSHPDLLVVQVGLGDILRREERFTEARAAYDAALALVPDPQPNHWAIYFSRGICAERSGDFPATEADMRQALKLNPDQPQVLNYLGYSYVDRGQNLDEALDMIKRAVKAEPESGMIIDSLAWAYFRLGRYADAVEPMEKASLLEPVDPVVTDHLGDVYWKAGRQREAEFQWHRALSFKPTEADAKRIRQKLDIGLDAVMADETAHPVKQEAATNGG